MDLPRLPLHCPTCGTKLLEALTARAVVHAAADTPFIGGSFSCRTCRVRYELTRSGLELVEHIPLHKQV